MIKIAFVIDTIESPTAGTEKQLLLLIRHLDRSKFEPCLCVLRTSEWLVNDFSGCKLIDIGFYSFKKVANYIKLLKFSFFLRKEKIDIVQTFFKDANKLGIIAGKLGGVKSIISSRRNQGYWHTKNELLQLFALNIIVDLFLANCYATKNWVIKSENINKKKISVIYNAVDSKSFSKGSLEERIIYRKNLGFSSNSILIGLVSNLRPVKSIDVLIKAASIIVQRYPNTGFIIAGEGPERVRLTQLCESMKLTGFIRFLGKTLDVPNVLRCIDIGVLVSSSESFSNSIVEYMATGLPVVCTDVGGAREAVEDGVNGFVVEPGNYHQLAEMIIKIIGKNIFAQFGKKGMQKSVDLFSIEKVIIQYQDFYKQALNKKMKNKNKY